MGCVGVHRRQVRAAGGVLRVKPDCVYWIDEWSRNECMVFDMATGTSTLHPGPTWCRVQDPEQSTATSQMTISGEDCTIKHIWLRSPPTSSLNSARWPPASPRPLAATSHHHTMSSSSSPPLTAPSSITCGRQHPPVVPRHPAYHHCSLPRPVRVHT
jgi:hypothetical protein